MREKTETSLQVWLQISGWRWRSSYIHFTGLYLPGTCTSLSDNAAFLYVNPYKVLYASINVTIIKFKSVSETLRS